MILFFERTVGFPRWPASCGRAGGHETLRFSSPGPVRAGPGDGRQTGGEPMSFRVEKDIMVPMRDGIRLATDAWIPAGSRPAPVLLVRLPYGKDMTALYAYGLVPNVF